MDVLNRYVFCFNAPELRGRVCAEKVDNTRMYIMICVCVKARAYFVKTVGRDCYVLGAKQVENRVCDFFMFRDVIKISLEVLKISQT